MVTAFLSMLLILTNSEECNGDTILPILPEENEWSNGVRAVIYLYVLFRLGMLYMFLGISIAADKFMEAISVITSRTKVVWINNVLFI